MEYNFVKIEKGNAIKIGVPYELTSVMQYTSNSFMKRPGKCPLVEYGTEREIKFNKDYSFTEYDVFEVNKLYDCLDPVLTATWTAWGDWSPCDATCERGEKYKCENAKGKHVIECSDISTRKCAVYGECDPLMANNMEDCPVEIEPSKTWGPWSTCSATCNGNRIRQKLCNSQACPDGIPYYGLCNTDCGVIAPSQHTTWSQWTECSETCDGIRTRQRLCGNAFCETSSPVKEECNIGRCGDPNWVWSNWLQCTATCEGTQTRYKLCGQALCYGKDPATRECNTNPCSGSEGYSYSSTLYTTTTTGSYLSTMYTSTPPGSYLSTMYTTTTPGPYLSTLYTTTTTTNTPENARDWGLWSSCSATCDGTRVR
ncbi:uncharacterized protein LOC120333916 [Styela clava]